MPHYLIKKQLQNTDKKHIKKMKKYLVNTKKVRKHTHTHTHTHTQLVDKGLNNGLYNYRGGIFPIGGNTASFCLYPCRNPKEQNNKNKITIVKTNKNKNYA